MSDSDPALIGRTIANKYHVEQFLGGGAMGAVYKARQTALDKTVAVKVMHRAVAVDPSFVMRFRREAKAASRIDHPNVMRVMDFDEEPDGLLYIAMEFLDGRDLYSVIHSKEDWPLPNARIGTILTQTLSAIGAGHDMGVIHRDLKPENIMILKGRDAEGNETDSLVKVCDFGIAKITEKDDEAKPPPGSQKLTTQGLVVGTPEYMSPEQARGEKLDARSDIYSIGVILYQLLTGRTPFDGDTPLAVVLKHITEAPRPPHEVYDGVHRGLETICLKALAKTPAERFQSAREMRDAIRAAIAQGAPPPVPLEAATAPTQAELSSKEILAATTGPAITAPVASANVVSAPMGAVSMTPLGTEAAPAAAKKKSAVGLVLGIAAIALLGGGAAGYTLFARKRGADLSAANHAAPQPTNATAEPPASATATNASPSKSPTAIVNTSPVEKPRHGERHPKGENAGRTEASPQATQAAAAATPPPAPTPDPPPPPAPPPVTTQAPPAAPAPPPAPAFDPGTCHAQVGNIASNGAVARKDLVFSAQPAWTQCARTTIKDRPSGPVAATVTMRFSGDNGSFRGATCAGCPGAVGACIRQATSNANARLKNTSGDVTGDPEFTAAVTFTCD